VEFLATDTFLKNTKNEGKEIIVSLLMIKDSQLSVYILKNPATNLLQSGKKICRLLIDSLRSG
jgi:hypothetical protein